MKKSLLVVLFAALVGCKSDDAHSLSRDYRNLHNEALDAMMLITSESRAKFAKDKIYKPFAERLDKIDKRAQTWMQNTEDKEVISETLTSDSVPLLLAECRINLERLDLERKRLEKLLAAKAQDAGVAVADASKDFPDLAEFVSGSATAQLKQSLEKGTTFNNIFSRLAKIKQEQKKREDEIKQGVQARMGAQGGGDAWEKHLGNNFEGLMSAFNERVKKQGMAR